MENKYGKSGLEAKAGPQFPGKGLEGVLGNVPGLGAHGPIGGTPGLGMDYADLMKLVAGLVMYALSVYGTMAYAQGYSDARYGGKAGKDRYSAQQVYGAKDAGAKEGAKPKGDSYKSPSASAYQKTG